ncbi:integral membrane protein [Sesbania bispinosa]|nr:integral membrane protein [Sesbania bispinosa]
MNPPHRRRRSSEGTREERLCDVSLGYVCAKYNDTAEQRPAYIYASMKKMTDKEA